MLSINKRLSRVPGKLLVTGEYLVLYGCPSLALPVAVGQTLNVVELAKEKLPLLKWTANSMGQTWFRTVLRTDNFNVVETSDTDKSDYLVTLLHAIRQLNADFLPDAVSFEVVTNTEFPYDQGLGTSSTLIVLLSGWAGIDPFKLFFRVANGSGYDIACALSEGPIIYRLEKGKPFYQPVGFNPPFHMYLYFVHLGRKQNSTLCVNQFISEKDADKGAIEQIALITQQLPTVNSLEGFEALLNEHEQVMASLLGQEPVKRMFPGFNGCMKSLGAWGGDFILVTWRGGADELRSFFRTFGMDVIIPFKKMIYGD